MNKLPGTQPDYKSDQYLNQKNIPQLFQSLTIALLYNQPEDHIEYLQKCLDKVAELGNEGVNWNTFLPPSMDRPPAEIAAAMLEGARNNVRPGSGGPHGTLVPHVREKAQSSI